MLTPAMSETKVGRRGRGEDAIYFAMEKNRYVGSISLGYGPNGRRIRRKVFGKTKQEVRERLKALYQEMETAVRSSRTNTGRATVEDWLREGLDGTSDRTRDFSVPFRPSLPFERGKQRSRASTCTGHCRRSRLPSASSGSP